MTDSTEFPLSTKAKKLAHDVQFATNIGRDSPFDPFQGRDITKLFREKKEPSMGLMHFANKPERRTMPTSIVFAKMTGREMVQSPFKSYLVAEPTATTYSPEVPLQGPHPQVSFTRAKRQLLSDLGNTDTLAKYERERNGAQTVNLALEESVHNETTLQSNPEDLLSCRERAKLKSDARPSSQMSVRPGASIGKAGLGASVRRVPTPLPPDTRPPRASSSQQVTRAKDFKMQWEIEREINAKRKVQRKAATGKLASKAGANFFELPADLDDDGSPAETPEDLGAMAPATDQGDAGDGDAKQQESEEQWLQCRAAFLNRYGLLGGTNNQRRAGGDRRGIDIGAMPSRNAPIGFHQPQKEIHENPYQPKDSVITKTRHVAHVELHHQASRFKKDDQLLQHVNTLLNYDHLSKLHQSTREKEMKSLIGLTATGGGASAGDSGARSGSSMSPAFDRPLTAADELAYNYDSLKPPRSKRVPHTSDAFLWATRSDEPLAAVLDGDPQPYRKAAQKELAAQPQGGVSRSPSQNLL